MHCGILQHVAALGLLGQFGAEVSLRCASSQDVLKARFKRPTFLCDEYHVPSLRQAQASLQNPQHKLA